MAIALAVKLLAAEVDKHEVAMVPQFADRDFVALEPEVAPIRVAHRDMAEDLIGMPVEIEDAPRLRQLVEVRAQLVVDHVRLHRGHVSSPLLLFRPMGAPAGRVY